MSQAETAKRRRTVLELRDHHKAEMQRYDKLIAEREARESSEQYRALDAAVKAIARVLGNDVAGLLTESRDVIRMAHTALVEARDEIANPEVDDEDQGEQE